MKLGKTRYFPSGFFRVSFETRALVRHSLYREEAVCTIRDQGRRENC